MAIGGRILSHLLSADCRFGYGILRLGRVSCHRFRAEEMCSQLKVLAYNLDKGHLSRRLFDKLLGRISAEMRRPAHSRLVGRSNRDGY